MANLDVIGVDTSTGATKRFTSADVLAGIPYMLGGGILLVDPAAPLADDTNIRTPFLTLQAAIEVADAQVEDVAIKVVSGAHFLDLTYTGNTKAVIDIQGMGQYREANVGFSSAAISGDIRCTSNYGCKISLRDLAIEDLSVSVDTTPSGYLHEVAAINCRVFAGSADLLDSGPEHPFIDNIGTGTLYATLQDTTIDRYYAGAGYDFKTLDLGLCIVKADRCSFYDVYADFSTTFSDRSVFTNCFFSRGTGTYPTPTFTGKGLFTNCRFEPTASSTRCFNTGSTTTELWLYGNVFTTNDASGDIFIAGSGTLTVHKANNTFGGTAKNFPAGVDTLDNQDMFTPSAVLTASRAVATDANGKISSTDVTSTELGYLSGVTSALPTQLNNKQQLQNLNNVSRNDHFIAPTTAGALNWQIGAIGAAAGVTTSVNSQNSTTRAMGVLQLSTGLVSNSVVTMHLGITSMLLGYAIIIQHWRIAITTLSDGTNTYTIRMGLGDVVGAGDFVDGAYFEYDSTLSANWRTCTSSNSSRTKNNSAVAVSDGDQWVDFRIESDASQVRFYIENNLVDTITTNIPTGAGRDCGPMLKTQKLVGSTARFFFIDYYSDNVDWITDLV